jgi:hypothetical protein
MAYLTVNYGSGNLQEKSKTPKEDFEEYTYSTNGGGVAYRKDYRSIDGTLAGAQIKEVKFADKPSFKQFSISFKDGEEYYNIQLDILNNYGAIDTYLESLITKLPNLKKGELYNVSTYSYLPEGTKYAKKGFSIKKDGVKVERALSYSYNDVKGDIPAVVVTEKKKLGVTKKEYDNSERTEYLYGVLEEWVNTNFPQQEATNQTTTKPATKTREQEVDSQFVKKGESNVPDFNDDLPF